MNQHRDSRFGDQFGEHSDVPLVGMHTARREQAQEVAAPAARLHLGDKI